MQWIPTFWEPAAWWVEGGDGVGVPTLGDFKPVKPSTDCASVLTMASKLSKLQCFSTCLSVLRRAARREAVSLVKRPFFLSFLSPCAAAIIITGLSGTKLCPFISDCASLSLPRENYPFILLCHKITAWWRLPVFFCRGRWANQCFYCGCACVHVCVCAWASSECQNVVMCDRCAIVRVCVCVCVQVTQLSLRIIGLLVMPGYKTPVLLDTFRFFQSVKGK